MEKKLRTITRIMVIVLIVLIIALAAVIYFKMKETDKADSDDAKSTPDTEQTVLEDPGSETSAGMQAIPDMAVGSIVDSAQIDMGMLDQYFVANEITDDIFQSINGMSFVENPNISREQLRYLKVLHYNFNHEVQIGELIVNANIAEDVRNIFRELFEQQYEIQSMMLVDRFWTGDGVSSDKNSIENNNTSAFNYRMIAGTDQLSNHAM